MYVVGQFEASERYSKQEKIIKSYNNVNQINSDYYLTPFPVVIPPNAVIPTNTAVYYAANLSKLWNPFHTNYASANMNQVQEKIPNPNYYVSAYGLTVRAKITHPSAVLTTVEGKHLKIKLHNAAAPRKTNDDVVWLRFMDTGVDFFPQGLGTLFPALSDLHIESCKLKELSKENFIDLKGLTKLTITSCALETLPDDLFENSLSLISIDFSNNKIRLTSSKFLKPFNNSGVKLIDLRNNANIDEIFISGEATAKTIGEFITLIDEKCKTAAASFKKSSKKAVNSMMSSDENCHFDFESHLGDLWMSAKLSDLEITTKSKRFPVHRFLLSMKSSVFANLFNDNEEATVMDIPDFKESVVESFLKFLYTNEIDEKENGIEMFAIAAKFDVPGLKRIYADTLSKKLETSDELEAYEIFLLAHQNSCEEMKLEAFEAIQSHFSERFRKNHYNDPKQLKILIDRELDFSLALENFMAQSPIELKSLFSKRNC